MAKKLDNIKVFACPLNEKIYVGYLNKGQDNFSTDKIAITDQALRAVMEHMDRDKTPREITCAAGTLKWIPNKDAH